MDDPTGSSAGPGRLRDGHQPQAVGQRSHRHRPVARLSARQQESGAPERRGGDPVPVVPDPGHRPGRVRRPSPTPRRPCRCLWHASSRTGAAVRREHTCRGLRRATRRRTMSTRWQLESATGCARCWQTRCSSPGSSSRRAPPTLPDPAPAATGGAAAPRDRATQVKDAVETGISVRSRTTRCRCTSTTCCATRCRSVPPTSTSRRPCPEPSDSRRHAPDRGMPTARQRHDPGHDLRHPAGVAAGAVRSRDTSSTPRTPSPASAGSV